MLVRRKAVACSMREWSLWFESADRRVEYSTFADGVYVSTDFLGFGYLFETMVFNGPLHGEAARSSTWEEASYQHRLMCARVELVSGPASARPS